MPFKLGSNRVPYDKDGRRLCGTPGCTFFDEHDGPCSNAVPLEKRPRYQPPPPKPKAAPSEPKKKRQRQFNPEDASSAADVPPEVDLRPAVQTVRKDGLHDFYHVHRWGQPLPPGPVAAVNGNASDDEADDTWRLDEVARRTRRRPEVSDANARFMEAWNAHVHALPTPLVSDRMLPEACRRFVLGHDVAELGPGGDLHFALREHLQVLWEHNLLHRDDVHDCLVLAAQPRDGANAEPIESCNHCARPLHEPHCALHGRERGAAAWPTLSTFNRTLPAGVDPANAMANVVEPGWVGGDRSK